MATTRKKKIDVAAAILIDIGFSSRIGRKLYRLAGGKPIIPTALPEKRNKPRLRRGSDNKSIISVVNVGNYERSYHATKGWRSRRI